MVLWQNHSIVFEEQQLVQLNVSKLEHFHAFVHVHHLIEVDRFDVLHVHYSMLNENRLDMIE